jgi:TonB family protein
MKARIILFFAINFTCIGAFAQNYSEIARLTVQQTWWYFDLRVDNPQPDQRYFRVLLNENIWLKDIRKNGNGTYTGYPDREISRDIDKGIDSVSFTAKQVADWLLVDEGTLVGGFLLREPGNEDKKYVKRKGHFRIARYRAVSADFIRSSKFEGQGERNDTMATYILNTRYNGGARGFYKSLSKQLTYPEYARLNGIEGYTYIRFTVKGSGKVSDISIVRSVGGGTLEEVNRVMHLMTDWIAKEDEETLLLTLPACFKLN